MEYILVYVGSRACPPCERLKPFIATLEDDFENLSVQMYDWERDKPNFEALWRETFPNGSMFVPIVIFMERGSVVAAKDGADQAWVTDILNNAIAENEEDSTSSTNTNSDASEQNEKGWFQKYAWSIPLVLALLFILFLIFKKNG